MTQKSIKVLIGEICSKLPKKNYLTNKTDVYHIDDIWKLDILDLKDYGPENYRGYRYILVVIGNFSNFGLTKPLKNKNAQTIRLSKVFLISSKTDRGKEFYDSIFQKFSKNNNIKPYSRNSSIGAVFAGRLNKSKGNLPKKFVFERGAANWIDALPTITKQCNNRIHSSTKLNRIQASLKKNEEFVCNKLLDKRKKVKPKFQVNDLVRTAVLKITFSKGDTTNWSYKFYKLQKSLMIQYLAMKSINSPKDTKKTY